MYLIALDTMKTITKGFRYYSTKHIECKVKIMGDDGIIRWMNKSHFMTDEGIKAYMYGCES